MNITIDKARELLDYGMGEAQGIMKDPSKIDAAFAKAEELIAG